MTSVREPAVAGSFYPGEAGELRRTVDRLLAGARERPARVPDALRAGDGARRAGARPVMLRALVAPHAGYVYSGPTAAVAYALLTAERVAGTPPVARVLLLGPTHRVAVDGLALPGDDALRTPLGEVPVDGDLAARAAALPGVVTSRAAHGGEHSLEVHLPFLQTVLPGVPVLPLAVGRATAGQVADVIEALTDGFRDASVLVVVSSDLSHYLPDAQARRTDEATLLQVLALDPSVGHAQACGATPLVGLLAAARRAGWVAQVLEHTTSADTAGDPAMVVGYPAVAFHDGRADAGEAVDASDAADTPRRDGTGGTGGAGGTGGVLTGIARDAIVGRLGVGRDGVGRLDLDSPGAAFVTLTVRATGALRGCLGSLTAHRPLGQDVAANAVAAAFEDPRFDPVTAAELPGLAVEVSVLSAPEPLVTGARIDRAGAAVLLRPGIDGVILTAAGRRSTFLPQVWEQLPDPEEFLAHLVAKAGLPPGYWGSDVVLERYTVTAHHEPAAVAVDCGGAP